jgi:hypothetical protein
MTAVLGDSGLCILPDQMRFDDVNAKVNSGESVHAF